MNVFKIVEGDDGLVIGNEVLDMEVYEGLIEEGYLELMDVKSGIEKFEELSDVSWMGEEELEKLKNGLEEMKMFENVYVGDNGECDLMIFGVEY